MCGAANVPLSILLTGAASEESQDKAGTHLGLPIPTPTTGLGQTLTAVDLTPQHTWVWATKPPCPARLESLRFGFLRSPKTKCSFQVKCMRWRILVFSSTIPLCLQGLAA